MNDQLDAFKEVTDILKTVKDSPSMDLAKKSWTKTRRSTRPSRAARTLCQAAARQGAGAYGTVSHDIQRTFEYYKAEAKRVAALPGGADCSSISNPPRTPCRGATMNSAK